MNRVKRLSASLLLAMALTIAMAVPGHAGGTKDAHGPACSDITNTTLGYNATFDEVTLLVDLASPACDNVTYAASLSTSAGTLAPNTHSQSGTRITYTWDFGSHFVNQMCSQATTSLGGHVSDYSPDPGLTQCIDPQNPTNAVRYG